MEENKNFLGALDAEIGMLKAATPRGIFAETEENLIRPQ